MRKLNFSSGPAILPEEVLRRAQDAIWDLDGSGIGILEHSHRGKEFGRVLDRTEAAVREVGGIGDDFAVLFVTSGATQHFAMVPQNFLGVGETADYCHTGVWSGKAIEEARRVGAVHVACTTEPAFSTVPTTFAWSPSPRYVHYTSNETIYGTEWPAPPPENGSTFLKMSEPKSVGHPVKPSSRSSASVARWTLKRVQSLPGEGRGRPSEYG